MVMKFSMKAMPLAAAMTAALVFGAAAHAQSGTAATSDTATVIASDHQRGQDTVGKPMTAEERAAAKAAKADKKAARVAKRAEGKGAVARQVNTDSNPAPGSDKALTAQERDDRKAARVAKSAERKSKVSTSATIKMSPDR